MHRLANQHVLTQKGLYVPVIVRQLLGFLYSQISAAIFAAFILALVLLSKWIWGAAESWGWSAPLPLARYDFLFLCALFIQMMFVIYGVETWEEVRVIAVFHLLGTFMELFKTHMGSWEYPEDNFFRIAGVPLFSGFMYASVGSYIARAWRIYQFELIHFPTKIWNFLICSVIYFNFFFHHFGPDLRWGIFVIIAILYYRSRLSFLTSNGTRGRVPLLLIWFGFAALIYGAENIATHARIWIYPSQREQWHPVPLPKFGSWYLLMIISFMLVYLVHHDKMAHHILKRENLPCP